MKNENKKQFGFEWQIDELVVKAFKVKSVVSNEGRREIESFSNLLSDTLSRLKVKTPNPLLHSLFSLSSKF